MAIRIFTKKFTLEKLPVYTIIVIGLFFAGTNFTHHRWTHEKPGKRGVIKHDVIHYYAYLTAGIIEKDLRLDFLSDPDYENTLKYYNTRTEDGKRLIITSMGLSIMYLPFFLMAHFLAILFGLPADGYSSIYQFFIVFGGLVYLILGLIILKNLLLRSYSKVTTSITLLLIGLGTNLYYYSTYEAAMPHVYNFFLIALFIRQVIKWFANPGLLNALLIGAMLGLISLIRPTNILVFFVLLFWGVKNKETFVERIQFYLKNYLFVFIMLGAFILVWTPQMLYWKMITGKFLYFSYGAAGASFYFGHPHIWGSLFSWIKGWYIYTPVMLVATFGFIFLRKSYESAFLPILILLITMIYVQSSWWSWWFGGGFGLRAYIDIYAAMALPLAAIVDAMLKWKLTWPRRISYFVLVFLIYLNWHQTFQYYHGMIHYCGMTKEAYKANFLKFKADPSYWGSLLLPDHQLARQGIYYYYSSVTDFSYLKEESEESARKDIIEAIKDDKTLNQEIGRYAEREGLSMEEAYDSVANTIYLHQKRLIKK